jgi:hypothetical protein
MKKTLRGNPDPEVVGFKLDNEHRAKLSGQAEQLGVSRNVLARDYVLRALDEPTELASAVITLNQQMFALREELALVAEALLTHGGKLDHKAAQKWVDENLKPAE